MSLDARVRTREPGWERLARRLVGGIAAALLLVLLGPVLVGLALWIRLDSPGPALLRQRRVGLHRRPFTLYKFRTMRVGGDDAALRALIAAELRGEDTLIDGSTKLADDERVTRAGRFLRRTSLDELPQLLNVLLGHMRWVGPRPCLEWEADMFPEEFAERFGVPPGVTGLWQVSGRSRLTTLDMLRLDVQYVRQHGWGRDAGILLATVPSLWRGDGAR
jgi:lipopolysaccharide/colanic/teichoic acid biosynthesis glycosyltransferase